MQNHKLPKNVRLEKIRSVVQIMMSQTNFTLLIYTISEKCPLKFNRRLLPSSLHPSTHFVFPFRTHTLSFLSLIYFTAQK
jgi:hypothetical protein